MTTENTTAKTTLGDRILHGIRLAQKRMLKEKALHGQSVIISGENGEILEVPAAEILANNKEYFDSLEQ